MERLKVFDEKFRKIIEKKVQSVLLENNTTTVDSEKPQEEEKQAEKSHSLGCSYCRIKFADVEQQREHYKLDWHRYNLKQSLLAREPVSEEEFTEKTTTDDVSSISGSDSDREEDTLDSFATAQGKIFLKNSDNCVFSLFACLLYPKREEIADSELQSRLASVTGTKKWTLLMLGGGHFAGAVFEGEKAVLHKTFHTYTVRAGQGGAQSSKDNKSGGSHPKSAGSSLRRYNEQALIQHVRSILELWKSEIASSSLVIYRAAGPHNRSVLFSGSPPLLDRSDTRLRTIPFSTRRPTFAELQRVHSLLTHVKVFNSLEVAAQHYSHQKSGERRAGRVVDRAKSRERPERPLPVPIIESLSDSGEENEEIELCAGLQDVSFDDLEEFGDSLTPEQRKRSKSKKKPKKSKSKKLKENEARRKNEIVEVIATGKLDNLKEIFTNYDEMKRETDFYNEILDEEGNSLLHIAAMNEQNDILLFLLENNANPCLKNQRHCTAYTCTQSKEIRESLKQFARDFPEKHNYNKAQIPTNVLSPEEVAEKKKIQRKIKKEKEKIKRKENEVKRQEEVEKERFLKLSDREKRALAAERRILSKTATGDVLSRCFLCAADISGKVPFEYLGNRFCTVDCLKAHRMQHPLVLS